MECRANPSVAGLDPGGIVQAHARYRLNESAANAYESITRVSLTVQAGTVARGFGHSLPLASRVELAASHALVNIVSEAASTTPPFVEPQNGRLRKLK